MQEDFLIKKLEERKQQNAFRQLRLQQGAIDFCSNDYLGIATNGLIGEWLVKQSYDIHALKSGSKGSRLLAGNYELIEEAEWQIARFHDTQAALLFNSGYDANTGLLSCVPQRGDTVLYDQLSHASLRDGIRLSQAQSFSFLHNDLEDLEQKLSRSQGNIFVVTESVFSMDGDKAPLQKLVELCEHHAAHVIIDEAHATGIIGKAGEGLVQSLGLQARCFARIHTFGKGCGAHGAVILGSINLKNYLINFSRSFIYSTALPEVSVAAIKASYGIFPGMEKERSYLDQLIHKFQKAPVKFEILRSETPIQVVIIPGNDEVKKEALLLQEKNLDVRPILYPAVPKGGERLRIVLHSFNTEEDVAAVLTGLR